MSAPPPQTQTRGYRHVRVLPATVRSAPDDWVAIETWRAGFGRQEELLLYAYAATPDAARAALDEERRRNRGWLERFEAGVMEARAGESDERRRS